MWKWKKMLKRLYGLLSAVSLIMGMGIYLFFRSLNMILFKWIPKPEFIETFSVRITPSVLSCMLLYNVPDMLWFLSGILFLRFIWFYEKRWQNIYIGCFYGTALVIETSQLSERIPGTFDVKDLFFMGMGALAEGLLYKFFAERRAE
jgi:glycopeptide antibiotics resistance protein